VSQYQKVKAIWILLKQETVSSSGISWDICKSAPRSRQITTPAPHHSGFLQAGCPSCCPTNSIKAPKVVGKKLMVCHCCMLCASQSAFSHGDVPLNTVEPRMKVSRRVCCMWCSDGVDGAVEKFNLQKVSLLRALCKSVGIQVLLREYSLDGKTRQAFYEEDIQSVFPVVKHIHPKVVLPVLLSLLSFI